MKRARDEKGQLLVESLVAVAIVALVGLMAVEGLSALSMSAASAGDLVTAQNLARLQLEQIKDSAYAPGYASISQPPYSVSLAVQPLDANLQLVTATVKRGADTLLVMQCYKVNR